MDAFEVNLDLLDDIEQFCTECCKQELDVGVIDGSHTYSDGMSVYDVACINEYGSADGRRPPQRAFIESTVKRESQHWQQLLANEFLTAIQSGTLTLTHIGEQVKADVIKTIDDNLHPHPNNAKSTIEKKGFDHPLIETGLLRDSIDFTITTTS